MMCAHFGRYDCKRHVESKRHKDFIKVKQSNKSISIFYEASHEKNSLDLPIMKAEAITCEIITGNSLSL